MERIAQFFKISIANYQAHGGDINDYNDIIIPKRATKGSAGYDFFAPFSFSLDQNESITIPTGIRVKMNTNYVLLLLPRSGLGFKYGVQLANTTGVIDSDYFYSDNEGHIFIKLVNRGINTQKVEIKKGEAFAQGLFVSYGITIDDDVIEERNGGFGSTNKE